MKIDNSTGTYIQPSSGETASRASAIKFAETPAPAEGVSVNIGSSNQIRSMENSVAGTPVVDAKKVAEIKLAISEGRFLINSAAIADSLIKDVNDLIGAEEH